MEANTKNGVGGNIQKKEWKKIILASFRIIAHVYTFSPASMHIFLNSLFLDQKKLLSQLKNINLKKDIGMMIKFVSWQVSDGSFEGRAFHSSWLTGSGA